jgi:cobalt/nickel transport system permease protein
MHIPDGFIGPGASAIAGLGAAGGFGFAVRQARTYLSDRLVPLAALSAAFVFAAQMINFPVLPGVSGHLIGGVLAAVLVGPSAGFLVLAIVLVIQSLVFADGGLSALGLNIVNLGGAAAVGGYWIYRVAIGVSNRSRRAVVLSAGIAAAVSVPLAAAAFAAEFALAGTTTSVSTTSVAWTLIATHIPIGIGEGIITAAVIGAVVKARPDLVYGSPTFTGNRTEDLVA